MDPFDPERSVNCGKGALAVHERFEGSADASAELGTLSLDEMETATGGTQVSMSPESIAEHLRNQGRGSHAVVGIDRQGAAGHWFNAYFDGDSVYAVDGQTGQILGWPPDMSFPDAPVVNWDVGVKR